ncbi:MAG TPA: hypothetical protein VE964_00255, partial [Myxococcales bacterium]|nr:hypothetical protein [Myxococcales bacterium]
HWPSPPAMEPGYPISAVPHDTPKEPQGPWALPGSYTVRLTVDGAPFTQPLRVEMDPRVKTSADGLRQQLELSFRVAQAMQQGFVALSELRAARSSLARNPGAAAGADLDRRLADLEGPKESPRPWLRQEKPSLAAWNARLSELLASLQSADVAPTPQLAQAAESTLRDVAQLASRWAALKSEAAALPH